MGLGRSTVFVVSVLLALVWLLIASASALVDDGAMPVASAPDGATTESPITPYGVGILNDGSPAAASLEMRPTPGDGPQMEAWLVVRRTGGEHPNVVFEKKVGAGWRAVLMPAQLTGSNSVDLFVYVEGQKPSAEVLRFSGTKVVALYVLGSGRPLKVTPSPRETGHGCVWDILEYWKPWQLALEDDPRVKGHRYAVRVFRWNGERYVLHEVRGRDALDN